MQLSDFDIAAPLRPVADWELKHRLSRAAAVFTGVIDVLSRKYLSFDLHGIPAVLG